MTDANAESLAARLRGFGPIGVLAIAAILLLGNWGPVPAGGLLVLLWAHLTETPLRALGFAVPRNWPRTLLLAAVAGIVLKLALKAIAMPLVAADPVNRPYHYLQGNAAALPGILLTVVVGGGFGEETVYRGFLFERFGQAWGASPVARAATVSLTTSLFALAHYPDQGLAGVEQAVVTGGVFGMVFAVRRQLWPMVIAHAAFDVTAVVLIYAGWEERVAHWLLR